MPYNNSIIHILDKTMIYINIIVSGYNLYYYSIYYLFIHIISNIYAGCIHFYIKKYSKYKIQENQHNITERNRIYYNSTIMHCIGIHMIMSIISTILSYNAIYGSYIPSSTSL